MASKTLYFTFGLFFPTYRHHCLIDTLTKLSQKDGNSDVIVMIMNDPEELPPTRKKFYLDKMFPGVNFVIDTRFKDIKDGMAFVRSKNYSANNIVVIEPSLPYIQDYLTGVKNLPANLDYFTSPKCYDNLDSATMRRFALQGDLKSFSRGVPANYPPALTKKLLAEVHSFYRIEEKKPVDDVEQKEGPDESASQEDAERQIDYERIVSVHNQIDAAPNPSELLRKRYTTMTSSYAKRWGQRFRIGKG